MRNGITRFASRFARGIGRLRRGFSPLRFPSFALPKEKEGSEASGACRRLPCVTLA
jgi:hypothetical protein